MSSNVNEMKEQNIKLESRFDINDIKLESNLNELRGDMSVKFHEIIKSIVKQSNERCVEFIESQKQSIEKIKVGKTDRSKCRENKNNEVTDGNINKDCGTNNNQVKIDEVSDSNTYKNDSEIVLNMNNNKDVCLLYTSRCV